MSRWIKYNPLLLQTSNLWSFLWYLVTDPVIKLISSDRINTIFTYRWLFLFFILLMGSNLQWISTQISLIYWWWVILWLQKFAFWKVPDIHEVITTIYKIRRKEPKIQRVFHLRLQSCLYKMKGEIKEMIQWNLILS